MSEEIQGIPACAAACAMKCGDRCATSSAVTARQCRKQTGHFMAATAAKLEHFRVIEGRRTEVVCLVGHRGARILRICGSTLFWQGKGRDYVAIAAGSLDGDSGLRIEGHIFCADKGDYYADQRRRLSARWQRFPAQSDEEGGQTTDHSLWRVYCAT